MLLRNILTAILLLCYVNGLCQSDASDKCMLPRPVVDKRVELVSIAFRLAGYPEYNFKENKRYVADIHQHFDHYAAHPLISFLKQLGDSTDIRFDAVMAMAVHLSQPPELKPSVPFTLDIPDDRWESPHHHKDTFIKLLRRFYFDSKFEDFFSKEQSLYAIALERYSIVFDSMDADWYRRFYGTVPAGKFHTVIGFGNGRGNYGLSVKYPKQYEEVYAVVGTWKTDSKGLPVYATKSNLPTLIHEFNHSFVNQLNARYQKQLEQAGKKLYQQTSAQMEELGYPAWKIMLDEALVRAAVIRYIGAHNIDTTWVANELKEQVDNGFAWMNELVTLLNDYECNRKQYPTLESFMPRIIGFYKEVAAMGTLHKQ